jgi:TatD DNase family protein
MPWIDTHAHLDADELTALSGGVALVRSAATVAGVRLCVLPAVHPDNFAQVRDLAHAHGDAYALGLHPLWVPRATEADLATLDAALTQHAADPRLVAVGEIGLDFLCLRCAPQPCASASSFFTAPS